MFTVTVTNQTTDVVDLPELCVTLGSSTSLTKSASFDRSAAQLDILSDLQAKLKAGTVSVALTASTDNADLLSIPLEQHGSVTGLDADDIAVLSSTVTFAKPFPGAPTVSVCIDRSGSATVKGALYVKTVSASGFIIESDVTFAGAGGETFAVNWIAVY